MDFDFSLSFSFSSSLGFGFNFVSRCYQPGQHLARRERFSFGLEA